MARCDGAGRRDLSENSVQATLSAARWGMALAFVVAALLILPVIRAEHHSAVREAAVAAAMRLASPLPWESPGQDGPCGPGCPARARAAIGVSAAIAAARSQEPGARLINAEAAAAWLRQALVARPSAGEWWAWLGYSQLLHGDDFDDVESDLADSYERSPFMAHLAAWRISVCAYYWPRLPPGLQARVENELVWLRDINPRAEQSTFRNVTDPAAREAFESALRRPPAPSVPHGSGGGPGGVGLAGGQRL
jgi:hypothetical protein